MMLELRYTWYVWITYGQNGHFLVTFVCNQKMMKNIRNCYVICQLDLVSLLYVYKLKLCVKKGLIQTSTDE